MKGKLFAIFLLLCLFTACAGENPPPAEKQLPPTPPPAESPAGQPDTPSVGGVRLGDTKEKAKEILGEDFEETSHAEAGHFPGAYLVWQYEKGYALVIGAGSGEVWQIMATASDAKTNLGVAMGDKAETALAAYRAKYTEPESIHGGKLLGIFKVEQDQALLLDFNLEDGIANLVEEIGPEETIKRMILTYPAYIDESF